MWLFEIMGLTVVVGTFLGLGWRFMEDFLEKRAARRASELEGDEQPTDNTPEIVVVATTVATNSQSN